MGNRWLASAVAPAVLALSGINLVAPATAAASHGQAASAARPPAPTPARAQTTAHVRAAAAVSPSGPGYWMGASDGGVFTFGGARFAGSAGGLRLVAPVVALAPTPTGRGYWQVATDGGVFAYGDASFWGSAATLPLPAPIVGLAPTPTGRGYWMAGADGSVYPFGDASWFGNASGPKDHGPVVGIARSPSGLGYWLVTLGGQVYAFGDAGWFGDATKTHLGGLIVGMAASISGRGYWLAGSDGGILTFGDARFVGSAGALPLVRPIVSMAATPSGGGYWLVAGDGGVFAYGDAAFAGSMGGRHLVAPVLSLVSTPAPHGVGVVTFYYPWYATVAQDNQVRHWDQGGHTPPDDIGSDYYPMRGAYSSTDPAVVDAQMAEIADAGIDEVVSSWWGQGSFEDHALAGVMIAAARHGVRVGIHLEPYVGRTSDTVASDVNYLSGLGITDIWVYEALQLSADGMRAVNDAHPGDLHLAETGNIGSVRSGGFARWAASAHFKAVYTYDAVRYEGGDFSALCASARAVGVACVPAVAAGFTAVRAGGGPFRSRAGGATYDQRWMGAIGAHPDLVAITSYNEWHEGTQIEPAIPKCLSATFCYFNYDGAYGLFGVPAYSAYIGRTKVWVARYRAAAP